MTAKAQQEMPMTEHLIELRRRLIYCMLAFVAGFIVCYNFANDIYGFLVKPLADLTTGEEKKLIYTGLAETFFTYIKISSFFGFALAFPVIIYQVWAFVSPGLYKNEQRAVWPIIISGPALFTAGAALAYYYVIPVAWDFFLGFEDKHIAGNISVELMPKVSQYLELVLKMLFAFGLCFQLPLVLLFLVHFGIASSAGLRRKWKYALIIVLIVAAILTPPDVFSQIFLTIPVMILYEISIQIAKVIEKKRYNPPRKKRK